MALKDVVQSLAGIELVDGEPGWVCDKRNIQEVLAHNQFGAAPVTSALGHLDLNSGRAGGELGLFAFGCHLGRRWDGGGTAGLHRDGGRFEGGRVGGKELASRGSCRAEREEG